jgi:hypothetical protein
MSTWLVLDLRRDRYAVGLLTIGQGKPDWYSELVLSVYKAPGAPDSASEADLAFFRDPNNKIWLPIDRSALSSLPPEYDRIESLLAESPDKLPGLLPHTLYPLLREPVEKYSYADISLLLLVNRPELLTLLEGFPGKVRKEGRMCVVSERWGDVSGFALLGSDPGTLPTDGSTWLCSTVDPPARWRYVWNKNRFKAERLGEDFVSSAEISVWESAAEMERIGAAVFALVWRDCLSNLVQAEIEALRTKLERDAHLLDLLKGLYNRVSVRKTAAWEGARVQAPAVR